MIENLQFTAWEFGGLDEEKIILFPLNRSNKKGKKLIETDYYKLYEELIDMEINDSINKKELMIKLYNRSNDWLMPRFNVMYQRARKMTGNKFKNIHGIITRIN